MSHWFYPAISFDELEKLFGKVPLGSKYIDFETGQQYKLEKIGWIIQPKERIFIIGESR